MIRRTLRDRFFLITQDDHAHLAGVLARRWGNTRFSRPEPAESTFLGATLHDCGWPLHDLAPTLNQRGLPLDVFETPREIALRVWTASAQGAAQRDAYAGLLVSLHVLSLSAYAMTATEISQEKFHSASPMDRFEINKFQHQEVERQEAMRHRLGLRTDRPLKMGLADDSADEGERRLRFNFRLLQAMDLISLALCCTQPPAGQTQEVLDRPGGQSMRLGMRRVEDNAVRVEPWPFDRPTIELEVPYRAMAAKKYENAEEFGQKFAEAAVQILQFNVIR